MQSDSLPPLSTGASRPHKRRRNHKNPTTPNTQLPTPAQSNRPSPISTPQQTPAPTPAPAPVPATATHEGESSRGFTNVRFNDFLAQGLISPQTAQGIPFEFCTPVQAETLPVILTGVDVLAKAKTGTGKTLAFLIPSIELLLRASPQPPSGQISILILSPTRELAIQISVAATQLLSKTNFKVLHVVGGTNLSAEVRSFRNGRCDILVATPGRMIDHLENEKLGERLKNIRCLVLDEADRLLEDGFRKEVVKIINHLPDRRLVKRQTLLFSATIPESVHQIASLALLPNHSFISTVSASEENTHAHVPQHFLIAQSLNDVFPLTLAAIQNEIKLNGAETKIMCFLPTARATSLSASLFQQNNLLGNNFPIWEIHSRKSQSQRNVASENFKTAKNGILFSSDVTARGMDFPGVTSVLQVGLPSNPEQYVHRLGRTARAGTSGSGLLILTTFESFFLRKREIAALPLSAHPSSSLLLSLIPSLKLPIKTAMNKVEDELKSQFYAASLGFYKSFLRDAFGGRAEEMVRVWNEFAIGSEGLGYKGGEQGVPGLLAQTVGKMGLKGVVGINVVKELAGGASRGPPRGGQGGGRGGGRGGARGASRGGARGGRGRGA